MATYTSHYQLHQWEASDSFLRTDFNTDFQKIDAAIKGVETAANTALALKADKTELTQACGGGQHQNHRPGVCAQGGLCGGVPRCAGYDKQLSAQSYGQRLPGTRQPGHQHQQLRRNLLLSGTGIKGAPGPMARGLLPI